MKTLPLLGPALAAGLALPASAQTVYAVDGNPGGLTPIVWESTGPPAGPCGYPAGPLVSTFPAGGGVCPGPGAFPPPPAGGVGDIAVDSTTDTVYVSDGPVIASYTAGGVYLDSFFPPLAVFGLGFDPTTGLLWITDGALYGAVAPPPAPGCFAPPPPFAVGPFAVPIGPGMFGGPITDIDFDPVTGSLLACDGTGVVGSFLPGPFPPAPFFGYWPGVGGCGLGPLEGVAFDKAGLPAAGEYFVTDGFLIERQLPGGVPAPPTFYHPLPCAPVVGGPVSGLGFSSHAVPFGPASTTGAFLPAAAGVGNSYAGNPGFGLTCTGLPGSLCGLFLGAGGPACPAIPIAGVLLDVLPPLTLVGPGGPPGLFPAPLPATLPAGLGVNVQFLVVEPTGFLSMSNGLHFTIALP